MGDKSAIEWTDATWNPTVGCSKTSPGCDHCYAIGVAHRAMQAAHAGLTIVQDGATDWTGEVRLLEDRLDQPLRWRKPRRIFVDSMSDLFHPEVPEEFVRRVFDVMAAASHHTFQILTKRPGRMHSMVANELSRRAEYAAKFEECPTDAMKDSPAARDAVDRLASIAPNVWLGTSIESNTYAWRARHLRATPAAVRFLSLEPLLGPLPSLDLEGIDWVIVGGQSGRDARPMHPQWVRDIRDRCVAAGIPFLFKQWGGWGLFRPNGIGGDSIPSANRICWEPDGTLYDPRRPDMWQTCTSQYRMDKKRAGRELDGRTWDEYPA